MEDEEKQDKDDLVEELTPALHKESHRDFAATVKAIFSSRDFSCASSVFHRCSLQILSGKAEKYVFGQELTAVMGYSPPTPIP